MAKKSSVNKDKIEKT